MPKVWLVAQHHFLEEARKRTFLLLLFALPLFLALAAGLGYLFSHLDRQHTTLGYVDPAAWLDGTQGGLSEPSLTLILFDAEPEARRALEAGEIDAYYLLPATGSAPVAERPPRASLIYFEPPRYAATRAFEDLVRHYRLSGQPASVVERAISGADITVHATDTNREFPNGDPTVTHFLPLIAAAIFSFLVLTTLGYLGEAVVGEKENRTIEVVMTSISASRLMAGKVLGGLGIALLQLLVWITCLALVVVVGGSILGIEWLQNIHPNWRDVVAVGVVALPTYLLVAAITTALGATLVETQEIQQLGGLSFLVLFLPIYLLVPLAQAPNGSIALAFTFFPLTSVTTVAVRSLFIEVPAWQVAIAAALALACGLLMTWLAGRAFRLSMLRYGQRVRWRELLGRRASGASQGATGNPEAA